MPIFMYGQIKTTYAEFVTLAKTMMDGSLMILTVIMGRINEPIICKDLEAVLLEILNKENLAAHAFSLLTAVRYSSLDRLLKGLANKFYYAIHIGCHRTSFLFAGEKRYSETIALMNIGNFQLIDTEQHITSITVDLGENEIFTAGKVLT
ncbi:MAG: hypothetical protein EXX96DRAFT_606424 [Benjaminiella poitrasii]|nr:MAG: hypothetical protein EXX96DRAFT_606424 [Benjaminiella poitrasii]